VIGDRPGEHLERLLRRVDSVLLAFDGPDAGVLATHGRTQRRRLPFDPAVERRLVLPHEVAASEDRPRLHPDELLVQEQPVGLPRLLDQRLPP
jgi:hypothetical protein